MKFLCDQMLGTLAKWLRIFGFDTYYANKKINDRTILNIADKEKRVLITRDKEMLWRAKRKNIETIKIDTTCLDEQIKTVLFDLDIEKNNFLSRCLICNTLLEKIEKKRVVDIVPEKVFHKKEDFWYCHKCNKVYWKGSHYDNMLKKIKKYQK